MNDVRRLGQELEALDDRDRSRPELVRDHPEPRRDRYRALDPRRELQALGYDYLTDETGLVLERIPRARSYRPLG